MERTALRRQAKGERRRLEVDSGILDGRSADDETATIKDGTWHEVGERIEPGKEPIRFFEMTLKRVGDTGWPAEGAISAK